MANRFISDERSQEINEPTYLHRCSKCGEIRPNTDFSKSSGQGIGKGRAYVSHCKYCRALYIKSYDPIKKAKTRRSQVEKHRMNIIFNSSKGNAIRRGMEHSITREYLEKLYNEQKGLCYYTNKLMLLDIRETDGNNDSVSIDCIDPKKGYIEGNIVLCRWVINRMKNDITFSDFLQTIFEIYTNFKLSCQQEEN